MTSARIVVQIRSNRSRGLPDISQKSPVGTRVREASYATDTARACVRTSFKSVRIFLEFRFGLSLAAIRGG